MGRLRLCVLIVIILLAGLVLFQGRHSTVRALQNQLTPLPELTPTLTPPEEITLTPSPIPTTPAPTPTPTVTPTNSTQLITVTTLTDNADGVCDSQNCSLRDAIETAEWGATIQFKAGLTGTIILLHGALSIDKSLTINGPGPRARNLMITGWGDILLVKHGVVNLNLLTISHGYAVNGAGGLTNGEGIVTITNCEFDHNQGGSGGAIFNYGVLTITNSTFAQNNASEGSAISNMGTLSVSNSTFEDNGIGTIGSAYGKATIVNSTFVSTRLGSSDPFSVSNRTIIGGDDKMTISNSIILGMPYTMTCSGPITDGGNNIQWPDGGCAKTIAVIRPQLDPNGLQDNGGPTDTIALLPISPAIGKIPGKDCLPTDQRGIKRPTASTALCDIGAFQSSK